MNSQYDATGELRNKSRLSEFPVGQVIPATALIGCAMAGVALAVNPLASVAVLAATGYVVLCFLHPPIALMLFSFVIPFDVPFIVRGFNIFLSEIVVVVIAFTWLVRMMTFRSSDRADISDWNRFYVPLVIMGALSVMSWLLSVWRGATVETGLTELAKFGSQLAMFLVVTQCLRNQRHLALVSSSLLISAIANGLWAIVQFPSVSMLDYDLRLGSTFRWANEYGGYLLIVLPVVFTALASQVADRRLWLRVFLAACLVMLFIDLVLTLSRSAWIAAIAEGILFLTVSQYRRVVKLSMVALIVSVTVFAWSNVPLVAERVAQIPSTTYFSNYWRLLNYQSALSLITAHPLFGIGPGYALSFQRPYYLGDNPFAPHFENDFLTMAAEAGILFVIVYCFFLYRCMVVLWQARSSRVEGLVETLPLAVLVATMGILLNGLVDVPLRSPQVAYAFWYLLGLGLVASHDKHHMANFVTKGCNG